MKNGFFQKHQLGIGLLGRKWAEIGQKLDFRALFSEIKTCIGLFFKFRALFYMCPDSSVGSTLYIFPLILVDQRGHEFKSTLRNNFFWPFFSASNHIIFYIYVICMLYPTRIRSQNVWVVYVYYRFILEQCGAARP